jgi:hypothetical protein
MRRSVGLIGILWALSAGAAPAQWIPTPGTTPGSVGVDVWSPVYPRTPPATVTHPATGRTAPQFDDVDPSRPLGVPAGNIIIYPSVTAGAFYDDNVFALSSGQLSDWAYFVRPEIAWRSNNWANAQVGGAAFVEKRWYQRFNSEDQINGGAVVGGTVQPDADTQLVGRLQYLHAHEDRGTSDTILTTFAKPLSYDQLEAAGAINRRFNRFWTSVGAAAAWFHFDTPFLPGFGPVSQAYRDGTIVRAPARVGYVVAPLTSVFVEASGHWRDFDVNSFDSSGYRVVGGMLFEPGPGSRIKGEFFAGYMNQNYSGVGFQTVSTWTYGALMAFLVTQNVTAVVEGRRDAKEASLSGGVVPGDGVSVIETLAAARVDWAIWPNVVVGGGVAYLVDEYLLAGRTDRSWSPLFSAKYFVNRHLTLAFDYRHLNFDSSGVLVPGYFRNVYLFSANFRI